MRYLGGKKKIAKWIAESILASTDSRERYIEPFVGSGAVFEKMAPHFKAVIISDAHEDLILMLKALKAGWVPPDWVSREEYAELRNSPPSALRGFVGFGSSFSGKWFGGYADTVWDKYHNSFQKPFLSVAKAGLMKLPEILKNSEILNCDYSLITPSENDVIYCDPPYIDTTEFKGADKFDTGKFWATMDEWSRKGARVFVSEQSAPDGWRVVNSRTMKHRLRLTRDTAQEGRGEFIFTK